MLCVRVPQGTSSGIDSTSDGVREAWIRQPRIMVVDVGGDTDRHLVLQNLQPIS